MTSEHFINDSASVPTDWTVKQLIDCTEDKLISYGIVQPGQHVENGIPILRVNNFRNGQLDLNDVLKVAPEIANKYKRTTLKGGEVLLTLVGSTGQSVVAPNDLAGWNVPRAIAVIRPQTEIGSNWINICLQSQAAKHFLDVRANTTVQKTLNLKDVRELPIVLPPRDVRRSIEAIDTSLNEKIQINRQINQTLEQMAQAIFKSWFVDFEPVKAKIAALEAGGSEEDALLAAMQAISGKSEAELTRLQAEQPEQYAELRATAELFPSAMQDSELGEIPEGWIYGTLSDLADFSSNRISKDELSLETYISTENMLENRKGVCTASSLPSSASVPSFESGEILISNIRPYFKKIWLANKSGGRSPDVLGFTCRHKGTNEYLFNLLYQDDFFEYMMLTSKGAKMPRGDKKAIMQFGSVIPPIGLMKYFSERVKPFYVLATSQTRESESLESLRDTLLPKLLSGELSVSATEDQLAEPANV